MARPLTHPHIDAVTIAGRLARPFRSRALRDSRQAHAGPAGMNCTQTALKLKVAMPKSTCSQHFRILREAGLIVSERRGVDLSSRVRASELEARFPGLLLSILESYAKETARRTRRARAAARPSRR